MALIVSLLAKDTKDLSEGFIDSVKEALARIVLPEKLLPRCLDPKPI